MCKWLRSRDGSAETHFHRQIVHKLLLAGIVVSMVEAKGACEHLRSIATFAPARAIHSVIRTIVNGWPTKARFGVDAKCAFCGNYDIANGTRDDIKHFRTCPAVRLLLRELLIDPSLAIVHLEQRAFFCMGFANQNAMLLHVLVSDVLYRLFCILRHSGGPPSRDRLARLARARLRQAATHSAKTRRFIAAHFKLPHERRGAPSDGRHSNSNG